MIPGLLVLAVMSAVRLANGDTAQSCAAGWFGKGCRYRCHCTYTEPTRCNSDGTCTRCQGGWFGPACQYNDLAFSQRTQPYAVQLTDAYDDTCSTSTTFKGSNVTIELDKKYLFTWLRVRVRDSAKDLIHNLQVFFGPDGSLPCMNPRNASLDQTTLDVHCDMDAPVQDVTLRGEAVPHLCSVYISGGRNLALLEQNTSQSSTFNDNTADKAVDGRGLNGQFNRGFCSSTNHELSSPPAPHWNVTFDLPRHTTRYVLYNRYGALSNRLQKFYLQSFGEMNDRVFHYTDTDSTTVSMRYIVIPDSVTSPVTLVSIQANNSDKILTLCEVEIYGDSSCDVGKYGRDCEHDCWCSQREKCFASTGGCPSGCAPGFHGESCHTECPSGLYGSACASNCSQFCVPANSSLKSPCHHVSGACHLGCQGGYTGTTCSTRCDQGRYGPECQLSCSQFCVRGNDTRAHFCDNTDGTCLLGCQSGSHGSTCTEEVSHINDVAIIAAVVCVVSLILVIVIILSWRRYRRSAKQDALAMGDIYVNNSTDASPWTTQAGLEAPHGDSGYEIPAVATEVTQRETQIGSQRKIASADMFGDDSVAHTYNEIDDDVASPYETVVDDKDITSTHNCPEYANTL